MVATILALLAEAAEEASKRPTTRRPLSRTGRSCVVGALAFAILFFFMWKWVLPRVNTLLEERREKIQGELEKAETTRQRGRHDSSRTTGRSSPTRARRPTASSRKPARTADQVRADLQAKAEQEAQATVARAQEEIRAERDRVFQELRAQVGEIAVELAGRVVGESLDERAHARLIDEYIDRSRGGNGTELTWPTRSLT